MTPAEFKIRFPEFASEIDARIQFFIDDADCAFDLCRWGCCYVVGIANYVAHNMAMANYIASGDAAGAFPGSSSISNAQQWTSKTVGDVSVTRGNSTGIGNGKSQQDSPFFKTLYGQEYLRLLRLVSIGATAA